MREYMKLQCWSQQRCILQTGGTQASTFDLEIMLAMDRWSSPRNADEWWSLVDKLVLNLSIPAHESKVFSDQEFADLALAAMANAVHWELQKEAGCSRRSTYWLDKDGIALLPYLDEIARDTLKALVRECQPP